MAGPAELLILALFGFAILLSALMFALWIYSLVHAIQNEQLDSTMKMVWILLIVFVSPIGSILYFIMGRNPTGSSAGQFSAGQFNGNHYPANHPPQNPPSQNWDSQ